MAVVILFSAVTLRDQTLEVLSRFLLIRNPTWDHSLELPKVLETPRAVGRLVLDVDDLPQVLSKFSDPGFTV